MKCTEKRTTKKQQTKMKHIHTHTRALKFKNKTLFHLDSIKYRNAMVFVLLRKIYAGIEIMLLHFYGKLELRTRDRDRIEEGTRGGRHRRWKRTVWCRLKRITFKQRNLIKMWVLFLIVMEGRKWAWAWWPRPWPILHYFKVRTEFGPNKLSRGRNFQISAFGRA